MKRNKFNLSNYKLFSAKMGRLIPVGLQEVIAGDTFRIQTQALIRMSPMLAPIMHPIKVRIHHWFVPYRILDHDWERFIVNPESGIRLPFLYGDFFKKGSIFDYFGCYGSSNVDNNILAYPFLAYWLVWDEFYRDEILQERATDKVFFNEQTKRVTLSGDVSFIDPAYIAWNKDRFTAARPFTQQGEQVFVPVYSNVGNYEWKQKKFSVTLLSNSKLDLNTRRVVNACSDFYTGGFDDANNWLTKLEAFLTSKYATINSMQPGKTIDFDLLGTSAEFCKVNSNGTNVRFVRVTYEGLNVQYGVNEPKYNAIDYSVRLSTSPRSDGAKTFNSGSFNINFDPQRESGAISIRELRMSSKLQQFKENRLKWGSRYIEYLQYLGIKSSDARLQLPEYLGGGSQLLQTSEVLQTAPTADDGVVGTMRGHGIGAVRSNRFTRFFEEHGVILSLMSVQPISMYNQGVPRYFFKDSWSDFFQKDLQDIGMQEVYNGELFFTGKNASDKVTFGYEDRYNEYRKPRSSIAGDFHDTLDFWHLARKFSSTPVLNDDFIKCNPSMRIFADMNSDPLWVMCKNNVVAKRMISKRANTKLS